MLMLKVLKWGGLIGGVVVLAAVLLGADHHPSGVWSWRSCPRANWHWHLETGYLFDDGGMFDVHPLYISGRWYRFGPVAIQHRWHSRIPATSLPLQRKTLTMF
jgi:hypothetical protein